MTAISTYALLCSGAREADDPVRKAIDFLLANPSQGVYASACRCLVWSRIKRTPAVHAAAQKDVEFLLKAVRSKGEARGLFFYDRSCRPKRRQLRSQRQPDGGPGAERDGAFGIRNTAEFLASDGKSMARPSARRRILDLYAAGTVEGGLNDRRGRGDALPHAGPSRAIRARPRGSTIRTFRRAINWLGTNFDATFDIKREDGHWHMETYALFAISRVGVASGLRYFGTVDWYQRGADWLIATQQKDGSWISFCGEGTALGLLFLAYGSPHVAVNKLEYSFPSEHGKPVVARWNQRPQDLLNFVDWMGQQIEQRLNWQVVSLSSSQEALHDAPILFIAGSQPLSFSDDDTARLRQFVEDGGLIFGNADSNNSAFAESFLKLGKTLFPAYAFRELPADHPIYTSEQYKAAHFKRPVQLQGLSNGVRELMLLPSADLSNAFQHRNDVSQADLY